MESHISQPPKRTHAGSHDPGPPEHTTKDEKKLIHAFGKFDNALCNLLSAASELPNTQRLIGGEKAAFLRILKTRVDGGGLSWVGGFDDGKKYRLLDDGEREGQRMCKKVKLMVQLQAETRGRKSPESHVALGAESLFDNLSEEDEENPSEDLYGKHDGTSSFPTHADSSQIEWPPLLPSITDRKLCTQVFCIKNSQGPSSDHKRLSWLGSSWIHLLMSRIIFRNKNLGEIQLGRLRHCLLTDKVFAKFAVRYGLVEEFKVQNQITDTPGSKEIADIFRAYVATVAFCNPHNGCEVLTSWLEKLYQPILLAMRDEVLGNMNYAYLSEKLQHYLEFRQNTRFAANDMRRQSEREAKLTIMAAEIGLKAFTQAKMLQCEMMEREIIEKDTQAVHLKSETLAQALAKVQSEKIERGMDKEAAQVTGTDQTKSESFTQEKPRREKRERVKIGKKATKSVRLRSEVSSLVKAQSGKIEREEAGAKVPQLVSEVLAKLESERMERGELEEATEAAQLKLEALSKAQSEKIGGERVGNATKVAQFKFQALDPAKVIQPLEIQRMEKAAGAFQLKWGVSVKVKNQKNEGEVGDSKKIAQRKTVALALSGAEWEKMEKKQNMVALKMAKQADEKQLAFQSRRRVSQQAVKENIQLDYEGLPLRPAQHHSSNINMGQDEAHPIIICDSDDEKHEAREREVVKELKALEQSVIGNIKAAPLPFSAKNALDTLVNEINATLTYSRFEDRHAVEGGDSDVHVQVILLWRGCRMVVGHAWEISEKYAGRKAAEALLADQHFLQMLARMRIATKENSGHFTTLLNVMTSAASALRSSGPNSPPSLVSCINREFIPVIPVPVTPYTVAVPSSKLAQASTKKAEIPNSDNLATLSTGGNMNLGLQIIKGGDETLRAADHISRVPKEESYTISTSPKSKGIAGEIGTISILSEGDSNLDVETLVVEDEILDDAHPTLRASKEKLSSRLITQRMEFRARVAIDNAVCKPQGELSLTAGITQGEMGVPGTSPVFNPQQEDSSWASLALQVAKRAGMKRNLATSLLKEDRPPRMSW